MIPNNQFIRARFRAMHGLTAVVVMATAISAFGVAVASTNGNHRAATSSAQHAAPAGFGSFFDTTRPARLRVRDAGHSIELGTRFKAERNGRIHGVRFWKPASSTGKHVAHLWSRDGHRLAKAVFVNETARGWQQVRFSRPVRIRAHRVYIVSYRSTSGTYVETRNYQKQPRSDLLSFAGARPGVLRPAGHATRMDRQYWVDVLYKRRHRHRTPRPSPTVTPSPTESSTPTQSPSGSPIPSNTCKPVPSACGYPDQTNTGPAPGTTFVQVPAQQTSGPGWTWNESWDLIVVHGANAVLNGLEVRGGALIDAPGVTLSNSRLSACGGESDGDVVAVRYRPQDGLNGASARIIHNELNGSPAGCNHRARSGVRDTYGLAPDVLVDGNNIYGTGNGVTLEYQGLVQNNWVHDLGHLAGDHHSGISTHGNAVGLTVRHNTVLLHGASYPGGGGLSGALTIYSDFGHAQNVTLQDNFISGGSYVIYGGNSGNQSGSPATNIKIIGNRFVCGDWIYGPLAAFSGSSPGNEWSGNFCDGTGKIVT